MSTCGALALTRLTRIDQALRHWAQARPDALAFRFLTAGQQSDSATFGELDAAARGIAQALLARCRPGQPVLLAYAPGLNFVRAYFACLYAGLVPVPLELPRNARGAEKLATTAAVAGTATLLSDARSLAQLALRVGGADRLPFECIATDLYAAAAQLPDAALPALHATGTALLQFTSGSTGTPKGVLVTHAQLLANERAIAHAFGHDDQTVVAGWLPLFHDMGLIGTVLQPVFLGRPCVLMSPLEFIQSPLRWLQAISQYRVTTSGGPNFGYALCTAKIGEEALDGLDLGSWRLAFNGAEPVRAEVMRAFRARFKERGFGDGVFYPCYGLAEATLFVSGAHWHDSERHGPVNCGAVGHACEVLIADPRTGAPLADGDTGEIWLSGAGVGTGYWNVPRADCATFGAVSPADPGRHWLRTGDLGFRRDGQLYPTGRMKDLIIVRGVNHYPDDIEATVRKVTPQLPASSVAMFSLESEHEPQLVAAIELGRGRIGAQQAGALLLTIRSAIAAEHGLTLTSAVLLPVGGLPRTSSGKLRRAACREQYRAGTWDTARLDRLAQGADGDRIRSTLNDIQVKQ